MPYANNNGVRIYYEVEGQGPPLMLAHGLTRSLSRWRQIGFVNELKNDFGLILFDARGHGKSDKPHDPSAYGVNMVDDVLAVLDAAQVSRVNYMGYSMGAGIGFASVVRHPERFKSLILGGLSPYRTETQAPANPSTIGPSQRMRLLLSNPEEYLRQQESQLGRPLTPEEKEAELSNDPEAFSALMATFRDVATLSDEQLSHISVPCLLYAGDADSSYSGVREASNHIPQARFFSLPGLDHVAAGASSLATPHIREFLAQVNGSNQLRHSR